MNPWSKRHLTAVKMIIREKAGKNAIANCKNNKQPCCSDSHFSILTEGIIYSSCKYQKEYAWNDPPGRKQFCNGTIGASQLAYQLGKMWISRITRRIMKQDAGICQTCQATQNAAGDDQLIFQKSNVYIKNTNRIIYVQKKSCCIPSGFFSLPRRITL